MGDAEPSAVDQGHEQLAGKRGRSLGHGWASIRKHVKDNAIPRPGAIVLVTQICGLKTLRTTKKNRPVAGGLYSEKSC
jgi:hypothetical protein